jgi:RNA polymerase sigma factor (sigma-70 family)
MTRAQSGLVLEHVRRLAGSRGAAEPGDRQLVERFAACRDEVAFATLVRRHGPMVLAVCRSVLRQEQDAEDAFQATFLVLARKAGSIRRPEAVAGWLYEVAHRLAAKAQADTARRRAREQRAAPMAPADPALDMTVRDLGRVLHEELRRLPEKYRLPLVLCYLEGRSQEEAAGQLGWSKGTLRGRLDRGRERLRRRLTARGVALSALLCAGAAAPGAEAATLVGSVVWVATRTAAGALSPKAAALAEAGTRALFAAKLKIATAVLLAASVIAGAGVLVHQTLAAREDTKAQAVGESPMKGTPQVAQGQAGPVRVRGRVLDPDGKPVRNAKLVFIYASSRKYPEKVWATSGDDGGFQFSVAQADLHDPWWEDAQNHTYVVAAAEGYGTGMAQVAPEAGDEVTVRLVHDDVPVEGRVLNLQGQPVAGATVRVKDSLMVPRKGDLRAWLEALRTFEKNSGRVEPWDLMTLLYSPAFVHLFPPVTTGPDGKFRIHGIGRERVVNLRIEGPMLAVQEINVMTRLEPLVHLSEGKGRVDRLTYYGARFDLAVPPTKPVIGVVRDRETGKPLAGVIVHSHIVAGAKDSNDYLLRTKTDADGRFRLVGLPKGVGTRIWAEAEELPYLPAEQAVPDTPGLEPVAADIALARGVWVHGRVTEKGTGKPVVGFLTYYCLRDNPHLKDLLRLNGEISRRIEEDGTFRTVVLPGPGVLAVQAAQQRYRIEVGADRIKAKPFRDIDGLYLARPRVLYTNGYHALAPVDAKPGTESISCDLVLDPGRTLTGTVLGPDGKPLAGARVGGLRPQNYWEPEPLKSAEFTIPNMGDDESRLVQVLHDGQHLAGSLVVRGNTTEPVRVQLQPWGSVSGRLVMPDGGSPAGVEVGAYSRGKKDATRTGFLPGPVRPDLKGCFRVEGLVPGLTYNFGVQRGSSLFRVNGAPDLLKIVVKPGEAKDLGDLQIMPAE